MEGITKHVLCLNSGSSSLKFALYRAHESLERLVHGAAERVGMDAARVWARDTNGQIVFERSGSGLDSHRQILELLFNTPERQRFPPADAVGHRVVHGGPEHFDPELITPGLIAKLQESISFAPLHLPHAIEVMRFVAEVRPELPQVACYDTAFHAGMPDVAKRLPLPRHFWHQGIRRYGFHGLSYEFILDRLGAEAEEHTIIAHLGNGASLAAVRERRCIDTTMGLTPTGGLMMGSRSGDLDPGVLVYLLEEEGYNASSLRQLVDEQSGLLGVSGMSRDMKRLLEAEASEPHAREAIELYCYQVRKQIGAMAAVLDGLDLLVFTGGIGERAAPIRARVCEGLGFLGVRLDAVRNEANADTISVDGASCRVRVIPTDEEATLARHTLRLLG